jgi:hypothetical protein
MSQGLTRPYQSENNRSEARALVGVAGAVPRRGADTGESPDGQGGAMGGREISLLVEGARGARRNRVDNFRERDPERG